MDEHTWGELAKAFVQQHPETGLALVDMMLEHFGEDWTIVGSVHSNSLGALHEIVRQSPEQMWTRITKYLGPPIDKRAWSLQQWLRGPDLFRNEDSGTLSLIPLEKIWEWVDEDVDTRAKYLASFVPKRIFREKGKVCLARELLARYGHREDVRQVFSSNFFTGGWTGPASLYFQKQKENLLDFRKEEAEESLLRWIDEYVSSLDRQIEREQIREEREGI